MDTKSLFEINIAYGHSRQIQYTKPSGNNIYRMCSSDMDILAERM